MYQSKVGVGVWCVCGGVCVCRGGGGVCVGVDGCVSPSLVFQTSLCPASPRSFLLAFFLSLSEELGVPCLCVSVCVSVCVCVSVSECVSVSMCECR